eukprot:1277549-Amphidinium_carterae.2
MKRKTCIVACGKWAWEIMEQLSTSDVDARLLRWFISDCAGVKSNGKGSNYGIAGMDVSTYSLPPCSGMHHFLMIPQQGTDGTTVSSTG